MWTVRISYTFVQSSLGLPKKKKKRETQEVTRMDMRSNKQGIIVDLTLECHGNAPSGELPSYGTTSANMERSTQ